jgi:PD-(D/E)XK nuclease superfamily protein
MILPSLIHGGYVFRRQVRIGTRFGVGKHRVDALAEKNGRQILVSLKWQQTSGTAEQKVPFEVISMIDAMEIGQFAAAYVVLGGVKWKFKDFYLKGGLNPYVPKWNLVTLIAVEEFVVKANQGNL